MLLRAIDLLLVVVLLPYGIARLALAGVYWMTAEAVSFFGDFFYESSREFKTAPKAPVLETDAEERQALGG